MAEREGFEPSERLRAQRFSRPPRSTTPAPLRGERAFWLRLALKSRVKRRKQVSTSQTIVSDVTRTRVRRYRPRLSGQVMSD